MDDPHAKPLRIGTLGINNGCIDAKIQASSWPEFAMNNTYGIQAYGQDVYKEAMTNITMKNGFFDLLDQCRQIQAAKDPMGLGNNKEVNDACGLAVRLGFGEIQGAYSAKGIRSPFDLTLNIPGITPPEAPSSFYNQQWVQEALGVPVNFTLNSDTDNLNYFGATGDPVHSTVASLEYVLSAGVNVAMVYGDRDYRCNCTIALVTLPIPFLTRG